MRKLLFLVLLAGCATEEQLRVRQQQNEARAEAVLAYLVALCEKQGVSRTDTNAMRGCVMVHIQKADAIERAYAQQRFGNALQGMGSVYSAPRQQQQCTTRPDYAGGWITTCN